MKARCSLALFIVFALATPARAAVPNLTNYQGRLVDGTNLVNGTHVLEVGFYNAASGGPALYADTQTVAVVDGLYSRLVGMSNQSGGSKACSPMTNSTSR